MGLPGKTLKQLSRILVVNILLILILSACYPESAFSLGYELELRQETFNIHVTVCNEGKTIQYNGSTVAPFGSATLVGENGIEYKFNPLVVDADATSRKMKHGETLYYDYPFDGLTVSGHYTLTFYFLGMPQVIEDIYIEIPT